LTGERLGGRTPAAAIKSQAFHTLMWPFKRRRAQVYVPPPRSPAAPAALAALGAVPGPSPWYLERPDTEVQRGGEALRWRSAGEAAPAAGKSLLMAPGGDVLAVADFQCYVRQLDGERLLVWYAEEEGDGPLVRRNMRFRLFDVERLRPIDDLDSSLARLGPHSRFHVASGEVASVVISTALFDKVHDVSLPAEMAGAGELLVLAHSTAEGRRENHFDVMHLRLWILDMGLGRLEIVPQDWFNEGAYDFGYQWVTRMARLPGSGEIVGEGIRLGVFKLDASRRRIAEWLAEDTFYHPER
jgi:hypothetical protein